MFDVSRIRRDFPILSSRVNGKPLVYLDNAATTHKPRVVMDSVARFYKLQNSNVHRGSHTLSNAATTEFENARKIAASFIGSPDPAHVIWTKGATEAANLLAYSLGDLLIKPEDVILVSMMEHHANLVPWQQTALRKGATLIPVPLTDEQTLDISAYESLLKKHRPKIVALTHVSNALGVINPVEQCCHLAKQYHATTVIDGSQAIAHLSVDVKQLGCDFYFFSGHKCYAPGGVGVLWGKEDLLKAMPVWQCGGEMIKHVSFDHTEFNDLPFKFEAGTPPIASVLGLAAALEYLSTLDRQAVQAHESALRRFVVDSLQQYPAIKVYAPFAENVGIVSLSISGLHHQDAAFLLDEHGIAVRTGHHCAMPLMESLSIQGTLRASFALYNTREEAETFVAHIIDLLSSTMASNQPIKPNSDQIIEATLPAISFPDANQLVELDQRLAAEAQQNKLALLLSQADHPSLLPQSYHCDQNRISGCESDVWLVCQKLEVHGELFFNFAVNSNAKIMQGLSLWVLSFLQGKTASEIQCFDVTEALYSRGLHRFISPSRTNGLHAIVETIKAYTR